jgi:hypothetical protein
MADIARLPRSGNDWTSIDLRAYNIRVVHQDSATFFGIPNLPSPHVDNEILSIQDSTAAENDDSYTFLQLLDLVKDPAESDGESPVADFVIQLFRILHYTGRNVGRVARTRKSLFFLACNEMKPAQTDVCIIDSNSTDTILVVQEDNRHLGNPNPEAQLIAEAISAFYQINVTRDICLGLEALDSRVIPGIRMIGTIPIFYKIPVTLDLVDAVSLSTYPVQETVVYAHLPSVPRPTYRYLEGMEPLDNRYNILSCYEAFRQFL